MTYITGRGMACPLGFDVVNSCAAIRAGISRTSPLPHFKVLDEEQLIEVSVNGCELTGLTEGFENTGRWVVLAHAAFEDLQTNLPLPAGGDVSFWSRLGIVFALPSMEEERFRVFDDSLESTLLPNFINSFLTLLGLPIDKNNVFYQTDDHPAAIAAIGQSQKLFENGEVDQVIMIAVDSYVDRNSLSWLYGNRRLKHESQPEGLIPGEAAVALLLEKDPKRPVMATISAVAGAFEPNHMSSEEENTGKGLTSVVNQCLDGIANDGALKTAVYADLNGERWRAYEYGCMRASISQKQWINDEPQIPALSIGDTGAASAAVSMCMAIHSMVRGYSQYPHHLILSSSGTGFVAAAMLTLNIDDIEK